MNTETQKSESGLLNKSEAAKYLHTTDRHVERLVEAGALGHCRVGRKIMFQKSHLENYISSTTVSPKGDN